MDKLRDNETFIFIFAIMFLTGISIAGVIGITIIRPNSDNTTIYAMILGITGPVISILLAAAVQRVNRAVNGRIGDLIDSTEKVIKHKEHEASLE